MQLVWAENVVRKTNGRVLVLAPLSVSHQIAREGEKFGIECHVCRDGKLNGSKIVVTNYEQLDKFSPSDFVAVVCDESGILKNFDGKTKAAITEFMRTLPYRLLATACAAPNDYIELGTSSEAVGDMGYMDMLGKFFKANNGSLHPMHHTRAIKGDKFRFRGHAERDFWRWVCSWARAVRKPSDLGFEDAGFDLPPLNIVNHVINMEIIPSGELFPIIAQNLSEQRQERRATLDYRCEKAAELINASEGPVIAWCNLNDEGDLLEKLIPDSRQVTGARGQTDEEREEILCDFVDRKTRVLIGKPSACGFGLNFQHCAHQTFFPTHSFEQWYQAIRRSWRFGQKNPVTIDVVTSKGEEIVLKNLQRKARAAEEMFSMLVALMCNELKIEKANPFTKKAALPKWI